MYASEQKAMVAMMPHLEAFRSPGFSFYKWKGGDTTESGAVTFPYVDYGSAGDDFMSALSQHGWLDPPSDSYDSWIEWGETEEAALFFGKGRKEGEKKDNSFFQVASVRQLKWVLHTLSRADRFCEGTWAERWDDGTLLACLERMEVFLKEWDAVKAKRKAEGQEDPQETDKKGAGGWKKKGETDGEGDDKPKKKHGAKELIDKFKKL